MPPKEELRREGPLCEPSLFLLWLAPSRGQRAVGHRASEVPLKRQEVWGLSLTVAGVGLNEWGRGRPQEGCPSVGSDGRGASGDPGS